MSADGRAGHLVAVGVAVLALVAVGGIAPVAAGDGSAALAPGAGSGSVTEAGNASSSNLTATVAPPVVDLALDWPGRDGGQEYVLPGDPVTMDASDSFDPDGSIQTYAFDVDFDGNYEVVESTDPVYEHTYESEGYRGVRVRVTDDDGETNTTARQVFVNAPPTARMDYTPAEPAAGERVTFDGRDSTDYNGSISFYEWRIDGTEVGTGPTLNWTFETAGQYEVSLTVEDDEDGGPPDTVTRTVTVGEPNQPPEATFDVSPRPAIAGEDVTFDASNATDPDGSIAYYRWDFDGDGVVDANTTDPVVTHQYPTGEGERFTSVTLTVVDEDGEEGFAGRDLQILPPGPVAACELVPPTVAPNETAVLDASGSENAGSYVFDVDADPGYDTDRYVDPRFDVSFAESGTYTLGVRAYGNETDRTDEADCVLRVNEGPTARFSVTPRPATAGTPTTLDASNSTDPDGSIAYYRWDFDGDGTVDENTTDPVTTHRFAYDETGEGYAVVELTVVDDDGAEGTTGADLRIERVELAASCAADPRTVTPGEEVTIRVDPGPDVDSFQYDRDATGDFGGFTDQPTTTVSYDAVGTYTPRVRVWNDTTERSRVVECGSVTVEAANARPDAVFTSSPTGPETGTEVTVDASASSDPDGEVVRYEWDFDGDGSFEKTTSRPTTTATRTYDRPGTYTVVLRVTDDDGATDATERTIRVYEPLAAECVLSARELVPGEDLTVGVDGSDDLDDFQYDSGDGDGTFGDFTDSAETTVAYDATGNYTPRVRVWAYPSERRLVVECPTVRVREENAPPTAAFTFSPGDPGSGDTVTFDASNSTDPDGRIVRYEWDFDGDGTVEATSSDPTVTHTYADEGNRTARLVVVDDRNASAAASLRVPIVDPSTSPLPELPEWWWVLPVVIGGAGAAGWGLRKFPKKMPGDAAETGREYAMGTFEAPAASERLTVANVGFEPDVVLLRAANQVRSPPGSADDGAETARTDGGERRSGAGDGDGGAAGAARGATTSGNRTAGLSIGSVVRRGSDLEQSVVSVADDAESVDAAVGATHDGKALDVLVHGEDRVGSLAGSVEAFTEDGFEVEFDASDLPTGEEGGYVVHYQAFRLDDPGSVDVGHFATPTGTGTQTVELGVDADYVSLTTCSLSGAVNAAATGEAVGVSHGEAVSVPIEGDGEGESPPNRVVQQAVGGGVASGANAPGLLCGHDDRAVHLPFLDGDGVAGRTSARVREVGERLELTYDAVHAPDSTTRVVTYLAMRTGDSLRPELGHVRVPAPGASRAVDVGFDPGMVALTGVDVDRVGIDREVSNAVPFDWSYGVAMPTLDGDTAEQVLHGSLITEPLPHPDLPGLGAIDPVHAGVTASGTTPGTPAPAERIPTGQTADATPGRGRTTGGESVESVESVDSAESVKGTADTGEGTSDAGGSHDPTAHSGPSGVPSGRGAAAVVLSSGEEAGIVGRDEVRVSAFTDAGFEVRSRHARSSLDERPAERRGVLFYTAWPKPTAGENRRTDDEGDEEGAGA